MRRSVLLLFLLISLSCSKKDKKKLMIATAANVQFAMEEIAKSFEDETGIPCEIILGSSGQLSAQIKSGAPYDVFVSANMKYPQDIFENNFAVTEPSIYAYGVLVLWTQRSSISMRDLISDSIHKIAIANPTTAPYGEAAVDALKKSDLLDLVNQKVVYGESISQVNQFVLSNAVDAGFTSKSVVISPDLKSSGNWIAVEQNLYNPIEQGVVVIKGDHEKESKQFFDFLLSEKGKSIFLANGYRIN